MSSPAELVAWADQVGAALRERQVLPADVLTAEVSTGHDAWERKIMAAVVVSVDADTATLTAWLRGLADHLDDVEAKS